MGKWKTNDYFIGCSRQNVIILLILVAVLYLLISLYFMNHCFFNTIINGVDVSLKAYGDVDEIIRSTVKGYKVLLLERDGRIEELAGQDIDLRYNDREELFTVFRRQNPLLWISALMKKQKYAIENLFLFDTNKLENRINELDCLNNDIIEPQNVGFVYSDGSYEAVEEVYGNKLNKDKLYIVINKSIAEGKTNIDLDKKLCYENPKYTVSSPKTLETRKLLNRYIASEITYDFGSRIECLDKDVIKQWLSVDENLDVHIGLKAVKEYLQGLSKKYDTVGIARLFRTSTHKTIKVSGGFYGWKINRTAEITAIYESIKRGEVIQREPIYSQKAVSREADDIGNSYVEINITRQHLWFYRDGRLIAQGSIVTGSPNRGNSTKVGVYMLTYKEKGSTLRGPDYEADVTYWMPFNGNIGIHDASWRYSFGGTIYKRNGTHGCVNVSLHLAKKIFDNIEDGTPVICYEE